MQVESLSAFEIEFVSAGSTTFDGQLVYNEYPGVSGWDLPEDNPPPVDNVNYPKK